MSADDANDRGEMKPPATHIALSSLHGAMTWSFAGFCLERDKKSGWLTHTRRIRNYFHTDPTGVREAT